METLRYYFKNPEHKIFYLNMSKLENSEVVKIIKLLNETNVNYKSIKMFNFGYRNLEQKDVILFSKWLLNKFSIYVDNDHLKLRSYLLNCRCKNPKRNRENIYLDSTSKDISLLSDSAMDYKYEVKIHFKRRLFADDLKMLHLVTQRCKDYLSLDLSAEGLQPDKELFDDVQPKENNCLKQLYIDRRNITSYKCFNDIEQKINFHLLIKFAYISFFMNLFLCIFLPAFMKHPDCQRGLLWASHAIFG